jgi:hypothetical protein
MEKTEQATECLKCDEIETREEKKKKAVQVIGKSS